MYPRRTLIVAGVLAFLLGLLALMPARNLLRLAPALATRASAVSGTLWQGSARLSLPRGAIQVSWDSHPLHLLWLTAALDWTLAGDDFRADGSASLAPWGRNLRIDHGELGAAALGRLLASSQAQIDQPLLLQGVDLGLGGGWRVERAAGRMAWGPGEARMPSRSEPLRVPALHGALRAVDGRLQVQIDGEQQPNLASVEIDPVANQLHLVVTRDGGAMFGVPPSPNASGAVLFELRQPLR